ncbi:competence/damage-inducible protein A [Hanamia caeni]|uniref:CinA-like protein n=1 Tax=Hanamia caeni TaxID=2294116 RepID=A0A3M9NDC9_9BACT|nr:competence/damage-inducible protein A [Hanamia caeni]RNI35830.1 competence/damage-inducible protein A [Hanamia caeni]
MENIYASIITIGDELLIGQVSDTNSAWIAQQLNKIGIALNNRISVGDDAPEIRKALDFGSKNSQVVLITGGLGPTNDDITKNVLCEYFQGKMIVNQASLENVKRLFEKVYKKPVSEVNLKQAEVPDVCEVIQNQRGSAPGMVFKKDDSIFISMPGVPYEMQGIMEEVIPMLQKKFHVPAIIHKTILTSGIGESALAEEIKDFEDKLPKEIRLAYLPNYGMVRLRLSTSGFDKSKTENAIKNQFTALKELVKEFMVADEDLTMQQVVGKLLLENNNTISTAESCTGGAIASLITSVAGSSAYFKGSVVSYSNEIKQELLGVKKETLDAYGAVSEQTAREMLSGILKKMKTDFGIAVTGIMGPGGGSEEKPVGTVYVAVGNKEDQAVQKFKQRFTREKNIEVTSVMALNLMRKFLVNGD